MIPTTPAYQHAVVQSTRSSQAQIYFGIYDVTAREDAEPAANGTQPFTEPAAIKSEIREPDYRPGTFEPDYFALDGSMCLLPDDANPTQDILGWWSTGMSDAIGVFATPPTLTILFDDHHSSLGIGIFFGTSDYVKELEVTWYNGSTILAQVRPWNTSSECNISHSVENWNKIVIRFLKTRRPYRYVRVMEVAFGLESVFDNDSLTSAQIVEEVDPSSAVLSVNTLKFTVLNTDQRFNMLNPEGVYSYLQRRQKIVAKSGLLVGYTSGVNYYTWDDLSDVTWEEANFSWENALERFETEEYEYIPMGVFYLSEWKNATGLTATLTATDAIGLLDKTTYISSPFWSNTSVEIVLRHIVDDAGDFALTISPAAAAATVTGYIPVRSHREALADVLLATGNMLRLGRTGIFEVIKADYGTIVQDATYDTILKTPAIEQLPLITTVTAAEISYTLASTTEELHKSTFNLVGTQTMVIDYGGKAAAEVAVSVSGAGSISGTPVYSAVAVRVTVVGTGAVTIIVTGKPYVESTVTVSSSIPVPPGETSQSASVGQNKLITSGKGQTVTAALLAYYQRRIKQTFGYWCNPAVQAGDAINVETMFGTPRSGIVERQEITISPNLSARLEVIG